ncbi:histidine phosphatase family protein [Geomonas nitrogeniifigens]|uniref:Histidine phosphatase family protein n=1 Tax=Geomonas diazotrophica TaxID=2843197 RepID=A0ABX8JGI5_9BACT|nr:histidine phosphatase family protein [Geomonas nitrogeniifigens]QWV97101.1 histidine phosphatase family protein [Geomonas nitrogeniifigens]
MIERTRIHLIRHGEVERSYCYNGHYDVRLTPRGEEMCHQLKPRLNPDRISAIYTSDLQRTVRGGEILGPYLGVAPVTVPALRELNCGVWEGLSASQIQEQRPDEWAARLADLENFCAPGGESLGELAGRVLPALREIVERHRGEEVLVVAHGGVNRIILLDAIKAPLGSFFSIDQQYCAMNIIDYWADGNTVVQLVNG